MRFTISFIEKDAQLMTASANPEGGQGVWTPPWKITGYMGFYREKQLYPPPPLGKLDPPPPPLENVGPPLEP